jgi:hypothetical protein
MGLGDEEDCPSSWFANASAKAVALKVMSIKNRHLQSRAANDWLFVIAMAVSARETLNASNIPNPKISPHHLVPGRRGMQCLALAHHNYRDCPEHVIRIPQK